MNNLPPSDVWPERRSSGVVHTNPLATRGAQSQPFKRVSIALAAVAVVASAVAYVSSLDMETLIRGEGYVPWRTSQAHAVADCRQYGKHVVVYTTDPTHSENERFQSTVLSDPRIQKLSAGLIWYRRDKRPSELAEERPAEEDGGGPAPPTVTIMGWDLDTVVAGPVDGSRVTASEFVELMQEALEVDGDVADQVDPSF